MFDTSGTNTYLYMKRITHIYSLTPEWQHDLADQMGARLIENKIMVIPEEIGSGYTYFTPIIPGISALYINASFSIPIKITRKGSENQLYVFHFDLSEHVNLIKINNIDYEIGSFDKLDLAIIDNSIESSFKPAINDKTVTIRILVDKKLLNDFIKKHTVKKRIVNEKNNPNSDVFYHYGNIDSNSVLLIRSIKDKSIYDPSFEPLLRGITLKMLGNFFNKFYATDVQTDNITEMEHIAITKTKDYLLNHLYGPFPTITFLASMAGMSESKFKILFKKIYTNSPNSYFINQKMNLARVLLKSGEFHSLTYVVYELNYTKLSYFSTKYYDFFETRPGDDLIKNPKKDPPRSIYNPEY
jgi:AraC-like DNA-binding protein